MNLVEARQMKGLNRIGLAVASGVDICRIAGHENGTLQLNTAEKEKLSIFFNMKVNSAEGEKIMTTTETPLTMPTMKIGKTNDDSIEAVQNYLTAKHGKTEAAAKLKAMSASDLIELSNDIANGKEENEANDMPKLKFTRNVKN